MDRRAFLKCLGAGMAAAGFAPGFAAPHARPDHGLTTASTEDEYPFPYDADCFEAAERIVFTHPLEASLSIIPKSGTALDIKLTCSNAIVDSEPEGGRGVLSRSYSGVKDALEIPINPHLDAPFFSYSIEYKKSQEREWKAIPGRTVKTPYRLGRDKVEVIIISDDHGPDDGTPEVEDPLLKTLRLSGDYVNVFLKALLDNPNYVPPEGTELRRLTMGYCLASTIRYILQAENPDFIIHLGDHRGGFGYKWPGLGLKKMSETTAGERDLYEKIFHLGARKIFSALTPTVPIYWALGNHDGEQGFESTLEPATKYRKKYFKLPGVQAGGSADENYYPLVWGLDKIPSPRRPGYQEGGLAFIILDNFRYVSREPRIPAEWTLGGSQKEWLKDILGREAQMKFVLVHHVLGGWPAGPDEQRTDTAYGRGPLFKAEDYAQIGLKPETIEQVELTDILQKSGVRAVFYGHDHIFHDRLIGPASNGKIMHGICVGSTKYDGELVWYKGPYWERFYGQRGRYGDYQRHWESVPETDFWGPSGYTKIIIDKDGGVEVRYIRSAYHDRTNIPPGVKVGDVVQQVRL
jgi:3',5'-cyclic AMP phosphodiesterase CpdA